MEVLCVLSNHLDREEKAGCFTLIVFLISCWGLVLWLFLTVSWVDLQYVSGVCPDLTHYFETDKKKNINFCNVMNALLSYPIIVYYVFYLVLLPNKQYNYIPNLFIISG